RLVGEDLRVLPRLRDCLRIIGPTRRERRVASLVKGRAPAVPAARQQPQTVDEDDRRASRGIRRVNLLCFMPGDCCHDGFSLILVLAGRRSSSGNGRGTYLPSNRRMPTRQASIMRPLVMSALLPLDSRQARITRLLLADGRPSSTQAIAAELELTPRVVRYNLPLIESYLRSAGLQVVRHRGLGVWISGEEEQRRAMLASLDPSAGPQVLDTADRKLRALAALLDRAPEPIQLADLEVELG